MVRHTTLRLTKQRFLFGSEQYYSELNIVLTKSDQQDANLNFTESLTARVAYNKQISYYVCSGLNASILSLELSVMYTYTLILVNILWRDLVHA